MNGRAFGMVWEEELMVVTAGTIRTTVRDGGAAAGAIMVDERGLKPALLKETKVAGRYFFPPPFLGKLPLWRAPNGPLEIIIFWSYLNLEKTIETKAKKCGHNW